MHKGTENFGSLTQKLGDIGVKKIFPTSPKNCRLTFATFLHMSLELNCLKNPENLIIFYSIEVGQIARFICYANAHYR